MGQRIQQRGEVVKGVPLVQPGDDLFWFNKPRLILYLVNFVLFQMGSTMKPTILNERVAMALRNWHHAAKKHVKQQNSRLQSQTQTPLSRPTTPKHATSQAHLLHRWHSEIDTNSTVSEAHHPYEIDLSPSPNSHHHKSIANASSIDHQEMEMGQLDHGPQENVNELNSAHASSGLTQHEINIEHGKEFSFDNK
ncbi:unnamed protein product [Sphenostylis stenocarpa]|uniref:MLO-like protein 6 n=1 Tax=Sphenostylis stenocarpa TaxID=92480 RepID=A0AA86SVP3_9FABA|nr:unnamed protein product [Sphenostylis stenocarpa]